MQSIRLNRGSGENVHMYRQHSHKECEIYYLKAGEREYFIENRVYTISPGDFAIIAPYVLHKTSGKSFKRILVGVDYDELPPLLLDCMEKCIKQGVVRTPTIRVRFMEELLERMMSEYEGNGCSPLLESYFSALMLELVGFYEKPPAPRSPENDRMLSVVQYINSNYAEDISVEKLAKQVFLSRSHFCRQFKKITGFSPLEYIHSVRLKEAESLLMETDLSITEIALQTGFPGGNYFGDFFRKNHGISPREWRKKACEE